jgi:hypothetical protein
METWDKFFSDYTKKLKLLIKFWTLYDMYLQILNIILNLHITLLIETSYNSTYII